MGQFGGRAWRRTEQEHRIQPGRGPYFTRRVLPTRIPVLRSDIAGTGVPRRELAGWETPARGVVLAPIPVESKDPGRLGPNGWPNQSPPYSWDIVTRLRAHWLLAQDAVVGGWAAAALHGLPYWADSEPVLLLSTRSRSGRTDLRRPVFRTCPRDIRTVQVDPSFPHLRSVDSATAATQCIAMVLAGRTFWPVVNVPGFTDREVRALQVIDAFFQCTTLTAERMTVAARYIVDRRKLATLLRFSDLGTQSPMETVLRLVVSPLLPAEHQWVSQVRISTYDGLPLPAGVLSARSTTPDLACVTLRVALYYDGDHHDAADQTSVDFQMFQRLQGVGWEAVRVDRRLLRDRVELIAQVRAALDRAEAARRHAW